MRHEPSPGRCCPRPLSPPRVSGHPARAARVPHPAVLGYQRPGLRERADGIPRPRVLVLASVGDHPAHVPAETLSGFQTAAPALLTDTGGALRAGIELPAHAGVRLRGTPSPVGT